MDNPEEVERQLEERKLRAETALHAHIDKHGDAQSPEYLRLHAEVDAAHDALGAYRNRK